MVKIYYSGVLRTESRPAFELFSKRDLSSFSYFTKESISEFMTMFSKTVAERTATGQRQVVEEQGNMIYAFSRGDGLTAITIVDGSFPDFVAHHMNTVILESFSRTYPKSQWSTARQPLPLNDKTFQEKFETCKVDPMKLDNITMIQQELNQTKATLHKTIESVLERGEKLDTLVAKSDNLSYSSRAFYTKAKSQNSCCVIQ